MAASIEQARTGELETGVRTGAFLIQGRLPEGKGGMTSVYMARVRQCCRHCGILDGTSTPSPSETDAPATTNPTVAKWPSRTHIGTPRPATPSAAPSSVSASRP